MNYLPILPGRAARRSYQGGFEFGNLLLYALLVQIVGVATGPGEWYRSGASRERDAGEGRRDAGSAASDAEKWNGVPNAGAGTDWMTGEIDRFAEYKLD